MRGGVTRPSILKSIIEIFNRLERSERHSCFAVLQTSPRHLASARQATTVRLLTFVLI